jgi:hypothetical protein
MICGIYWFLDLIYKPSKPYKMRSIVLEMGIEFVCKFQIIQTLISVSIAFLYRHKIIEILSKLDKIDAMVKIFSSL